MRFRNQNKQAKMQCVLFDFFYLYSLFQNGLYSISQLTILIKERHSLLKSIFKKPKLVAKMYQMNLYFGIILISKASKNRINYNYLLPLFFYCSCSN